MSSWDNILCLGVDVGSVDENLNLLGNDHLHVDRVCTEQAARSHHCRRERVIV